MGIKINIESTRRQVSQPDANIGKFVGQDPCDPDMLAGRDSCQRANSNRER